MATYHFQINSGHRGTAHRHSRYADRQGAHRHRNDLAFSEHGNLPPWSNDEPDKFWKASDKYERKNGAAYREYVIALPSELSRDDGVALAKTLTKSIAGIKPYQLALHSGVGKLAGAANPHIHLMVSDRVPDGIERSPQQTFARYNSAHPERGGCRKDSGGLTRAQLRKRVVALRKQVADAINDALAKHGIETKVDHRSLKDQGIQRQPEHHLGPSRVRGMSDEDREAYKRFRRNGVGMELPPTNPKK